jgi:hypothetical protein
VLSGFIGWAGSAFSWLGSVTSLLPFAASFISAFYSDLSLHKSPHHGDFFTQAGKAARLGNSTLKEYPAKWFKFLCFLNPLKLGSKFGVFVICSSFQKRNTIYRFSKSTVTLENCAPSVASIFGHSFQIR